MRKLILIVLLWSLLTPSLQAVTENASYPKEFLENQYNDPIFPSQFYPPAFTNQVPYYIDVVFLGYNQSTFNFSLFESSLHKWTAPIERIPSGGVSDFIFDTNFTIEYQYEFYNNPELTTFKDYIFQHKSTDRAPYWISNDSETVAYIDSNSVETYLQDTYISDSKPTFFFINTFSNDSINHSTYFYNASSTDPDGVSIPRRYGSQYQISGGGEHSRILWLDLSSGPSKYRDDGFWGSAGINETTIPPIWDYNTTQRGKNQLAMDMSFYLNSALELRFLPSYIYSPNFDTQEIHFSLNLINLDTTGFNWMDAIDIDLMLEQYARLNPNIEWTTEIDEINLDGYPDFKDIINSAKNPGTRSYTSYEIMTYLDENYTRFVDQGSPNKLVIPVFLFGFEEDYLFENFLGVATSIDYAFSYILASTNVYFAEQTQKISIDNWIFEEDLVIPQNTHVAYSGLIGSVTELVISEFTVASGEINAYLVDQKNLKKYVKGESFSPISKRENITDFSVLSYEINVISNFTWIIENASGGAATLDFNVNVYTDRSFGFTFIAMHEIGHSLGLPHPHDGFTWHGNKFTSATKEYVYWLWDFSSTQMTYAHHHRNISQIDIDTYQRGIFPKVYTQTIHSLTSLLNKIKVENLFVPEFLVSNLENIHTNISSSLLDYKSVATEYNYRKALDRLSLARDLITNSTRLLQEISLSHILSIKLHGHTSEEIRTEISDNGNLILNESTYFDTEYNLTSLSWSDYTIRIYIDNTIYRTFSGLTWQLPSTINVYMGTATPPQTLTTTNNQTTGGSTRTTTSSDQNNVNFYSIHFIHLGAAVLIVMSKRWKLNNYRLNQDLERTNKK